MLQETVRQLVSEVGVSEEGERRGQGRRRRVLVLVASVFFVLSFACPLSVSRVRACVYVCPWPWSIGKSIKREDKKVRRQNNTKHCDGLKWC